MNQCCKESITKLVVRLQMLFDPNNKVKMDIGLWHIIQTEIAKIYNEDKE